MTFGNMGRKLSQGHKDAISQGLKIAYSQGRKKRTNDWTSHGDACGS